MNPRILLLILVIVLVALGIYAFARQTDDEMVVVPEPTTFEECAARYPVMESNPRRCIANGVEFTETITAPAPPPAAPGIPNLITVTSPTSGQRITSPLTITGQARGNWYFEASFPVELKNAAGVAIARHYAEAQGEWMTENFVPFRSILTFPAQPAGSTGTLILHKDNPSGLPENDRSVSIPVTF